MSQERADLNWYHQPPDYFAVRDRSPRESAPSVAPVAQTAQQAKAGPDHDTAEGSFTFDDFLDIINPLHHLPVISMAYRAVTGDQISAHARIIGGGLYGGGSGFVGAIVNSISEEASGRDLGDNLMAAVFGEDETASESVAARSGTSPDPGQSAAGPVAERESAALADETRTAAQPQADPAAVGLAEVSLRTSPPAGGSDPLEGQAALSALFADLRGGAKSADRGVPGPADGARAEAAPGAEPRPAQTSLPGPVPRPAPGRITFDPMLFAGPGEPPAESDQPPGSAPVFANQMLLGLQKYEELMSGRQLSQSEPMRVDREL